ncbi:hypothetical protein Hanom_Chr13g01195831 [Helianthus anomalus]
MLAEITEEPEQIVEEAAEDEGEICFDIPYDDETNLVHEAFRSMLPSHMCNPFTSFFCSISAHWGIQPEEPKKEPVEEIIDIKK